MLYFAYGSNMLSRRLQARVPSARAVGTGTLAAHRLRWHEPGMDGSGKCDAHATGDATDLLWGVLFTFDAAERGPLDAAEGLGVHYGLAEVSVATASGPRAAWVYRALHAGPDAAPYRWYRELVLQGAREHGLPAAYVRTMIEAIAAVDDPDAPRAALHQRLLDAS